MDIFTHQSVETQNLCISLLFTCPAHKDLSSCPLFKIKKEPFPNRIAWLKLRSQTELRDLLNYHSECYKS